MASQQKETLKKNSCFETRYLSLIVQNTISGMDLNIDKSIKRTLLQQQQRTNKTAGSGIDGPDQNALRLGLISYCCTF
jgi:hypothetical protein